MRATLALLLLQLLPDSFLCIFQEPWNLLRPAALHADGSVNAMDLVKGSDSEDYRAVTINDAGSTKSANVQGPSLLQKSFIRRQHAAKAKQCGGIVSASGGGVAWEAPILVNNKLHITQGHQSQTSYSRGEDIKFRNLPQYLMAGHGIKPQKILPSGEDWTWTISYQAPVKIYILAWSGAKLREEGGQEVDLNAHLDASVEKAGWTQEEAPGLEAVSDSSKTFKVYSKSFTDASVSEAHIYNLKGELFASAISSPCGTVIDVKGGGVEWHPPTVMADDEPANPGHTEFTLVNVPTKLIGGRYVGSKGIPSGTDYALTITYEPPVKLNIWVWADPGNAPHHEIATNNLDYNGGLNAVMFEHGWSSEPANSNGPFHRSDDTSHRLEVWSKVFNEGSEVVLEHLHGEMVAGVVSTEP
jgi:hypothetical protein